MEKKIEDVKFQIKIIGEDIQETRDFIGDWKREKQETVEKRIPELNAKQEQSYALLAEQYTEQFTKSQEFLAINRNWHDADRRLLYRRLSHLP